MRIDFLGIMYVYVYNCIKKKPLLGGSDLTLNNISSDLLQGFNNSLKSFRIIHSQISQSFAIQSDVPSVNFTHKFRIAHTMLTRCRIDSLNPKSTEVTLFGAAVTVGISEAFLNGVFSNSPHILTAAEGPFGQFQHLFSAGP